MVRSEECITPRQSPLNPDNMNYCPASLTSKQGNNDNSCFLHQSQINKMDSKLRPDNPESLIRRLADMRHVVNLDSVLHSSYYCADI